jgi:hypothetical protein
MLIGHVAVAELLLKVDPSVPVLPIAVSVA